MRIYVHTHARTYARTYIPAHAYLFLQVIRIQGNCVNTLLVHNPKEPIKCATTKEYVPQTATNRPVCVTQAIAGSHVIFRTALETQNVEVGLLRGIIRNTWPPGFRNICLMTFCATTWLNLGNGLVCIYLNLTFPRSKSAVVNVYCSTNGITTHPAKLSPRLSKS